MGQCPGLACWRWPAGGWGCCGPAEGLTPLSEVRQPVPEGVAGVLDGQLHPGLAGFAILPFNDPATVPITKFDDGHAIGVHPDAVVTERVVVHPGAFVPEDGLDLLLAHAPAD